MMLRVCHFADVAAFAKRWSVSRVRVADIEPFNTDAMVHGLTTAATK